MGKVIGKYVWCYQKFPDAGLTDTPFKGKIVEESAFYWSLKVGRRKQIFKANKGACSVVPFEEKEIGTKEYRAKVAKKANLKKLAERENTPANRGRKKRVAKKGVRKTVKRGT